MNIKTLNKLLLPYTYEKAEIVRLFEITLLLKGHILIEDLPGVGKTTLAKAFSHLLGRSFSRIQGTSDTLPSDILGGEILNLKTKDFEIKKGPIFSEVVVIDEINRMHPKTQSAFLEAMEEKSVSLAGKKYPLPKIHMILATQNPIEYSGTNPLPEAQRDRFACAISLGFPSREKQIEILQSNLNINEEIEKLPQILNEEEIEDFSKKVKTIHIEENLLERIVDFAQWTRSKELFRYGLSPRGISLFCNALKAYALLEERDYVLPEDAIPLIKPFLLHRIESLETNDKEALHQIIETQYRKYMKI